MKAKMEVRSAHPSNDGGEEVKLGAVQGEPQGQPQDQDTVRVTGDLTVKLSPQQKGKLKAGQKVDLEISEGQGQPVGAQAQPGQRQTQTADR